MNGRVNLESAQPATGSFDQVRQQFNFATSLNAAVGADLVKGNIEKNVLNSQWRDNSSQNGALGKIPQF